MYVCICIHTHVYMFMVMHLSLSLCLHDRPVCVCLRICSTVHNCGSMCESCREMQYGMRVVKAVVIVCRTAQNEHRCLHK